MIQLLFSMLRNVFRIVNSQQRRNSTFQKIPIETVSAVLHNHLFNDVVPSTASATQLDMKLPKLRNPSLIEHFRIISEEQVKDYQSLLENASLDFLKKFKLPAAWEFRTGWTRYSHHDGSQSQVPYPLEDVFVFDVETCVQRGQLPTIAVALSNDAWYSWCSELLVNDTPYPPYPGDDLLIPLGGHANSRVAIGHNVGYDRARAREPYSRQKTSIRFMDTMSMSIPMFGMADHQRAFREKDDIARADENHGRIDRELWFDEWKKRVCKNSLVAVDEFFNMKHGVPKSRQLKADKSFQKFFVDEPIETIREYCQNKQELFFYCAQDVLLCANIFTKLWPEFKLRYPDPASLNGMLSMGNAYLPINQNWLKFYEKNERSCEDKKDHAAHAIVTAAQDVISNSTFDGSRWTPSGEFDPWMWPFSWEATGKNPIYPEWYFKLFKKRTLAKKAADQLTHEDIVMKSALLPAVFGMLYGPYPVYKSRLYGWGYLVPSGTSRKTKTGQCSILTDEDLMKFKSLVVQNRLEFGDLPLPSKHTDIVEGLKFYQIPHPNGSGNLGDILSKHFFDAIETKAIRATRYETEFEQLLNAVKTTRFWAMYSDRFNSEVPIWYGDSTIEADDGKPQVGAIAAAIIPAGTVSRRSVHKLWVTLTNSSDDEVIGVGIKSMVQAPPGYTLVGADVDSQEQWLAGLYGDASAAKALAPSERIAGLTPFSNMMLAGSKSKGTDLHTVVAKQLRIGRGQAKTLNYARLYGAGEKNAVQSLTQSGTNANEAARIARELFSLTKGVTMSWHRLRPEAQLLFDEFLAWRKVDGDAVDSDCYLTVDGHYYLPDYDTTLKHRTLTMAFERWVLDRLATLTSSEPSDDVVALLYHNYDKAEKYYTGGYESATFNFLEQQASLDEMRTPVLGCQLADSLAQLPPGTPQRDEFAAKYKRSVMNWLVQSSAVDFLHLLLVCMEWLCRDYDIDARFVISIHDEVRYLCRQEDAPRLALALMLSNMYVRAFISQKVGIEQLPMSVAFFSQVDCDTILRKEVDSPVRNPDGTTVPNGIAWSMDDLLKLTKGSLAKPVHEVVENV